jgi:metallo-beta-lactamase class B
VVNRYLGEAHSKDNIVTWVPKEKILFGGCMIKSLGASRGYLGDANLQQWSPTVEKVKKAFSNAAIVIPGHGSHGTTELLDYTIKMFQGETK